MPIILRPTTCKDIAIMTSTHWCSYLLYLGECTRLLATHYFAIGYRNFKNSSRMQGWIQGREDLGGQGDGPGMAESLW